MLTAVACAAILGSTVPDKVDFQLRWKVGDELTYTVDQKMSPILLDSTGELVMTVKKASEKTYIVSMSQVVFRNEGRAASGDLRAGDVTMTKYGKLVAGTTNTRAFLAFLALPEEPVEVGGSFKVKCVIPVVEITIELEGKFVSLGGPTGTLATLRLKGEFPVEDGEGWPITVKTTFDTARGVIVSYSSTLTDIRSSIKLKQGRRALPSNAAQALF